MNTILRLWEQENIPSLQEATRIILIGVGRFGSKALERLSRRYPRIPLTVVDLRKEALDTAAEKAAGAYFVLSEGVDYLVKNPPEENAWIIPALPVHLAFLWLCGVLSLSGRGVKSCPLPEDLPKKLPNAFIYNPDCLFTSNATFICPDYCSEPDDFCTYTKEPRKPDLFSTIADAIPNGWMAAVVRSFQLAPGVGGYPARHLHLLRHWAEKLPSGRPFIVATACRCHGVVQAGQIS